MNRLISLLITTLTSIYCNAQITLQYCLEKADENYPMIKRYELIEKTKSLNLSDINKGWLPRVGIYGQTTLQNIVPSFPEPLENVLTQMGHEMKGLGHLQYKVGIDINQPIWDGGMSKAQRSVERATTAEAKASLSVQIYTMHERVMDIFFGILLMDEQIAQTNNTIELLNANLSRMKSMLTNGVAMQSDVDMLEAQILTMTQHLSEAQSARKGYRDMLEIYIAESLDGKKLVKPTADMPSEYNTLRPELEMFDAKIRLNNAKSATIGASVMPRIGFFAQAYYGYPGFNYFESMINRDLSFNALAGIKLSWNIDAFYTKKSAHSKLITASEVIENDRQVFLFNNRLQAKSQTDAIDGLRKVMTDDERIVALRQNVRHAAESQLQNGVIDATSLLTKITDENQARLTACYHEIQLLQKIYQLKYTLNR